MCNLYSVFTTKADLARMFGVATDQTSNQPPQPAVFPDQMAPVVRFDAAGSRVMHNMRWGFPPAPNSKEKQTTNVRNLKSPWWRPWLKPEYRCLVPVSSFCEYHDIGKRPHWFALGPERPPFAFAGIWRPWTGARGTKAERKALLEQTGSEEAEHLVYAFLTCKANELVEPVHRKAMPVMLTTPEEWDAWLTAPAEDVATFQRPFPMERLFIVATGQRQDAAA